MTKELTAHTVTIAIDDILGSLPSADGGHMLLLIDSGGQQHHIAVATTALGKLISACALERIQCRAAQGVTEIPGFDVTWWDFGHELDQSGEPTGRGALDFTLGNGGKLRFHLNTFMQESIRDALMVATNSGVASPSGELN